MSGVEAPIKQGCGYNETSTIYVQGCNGHIGKTVYIPRDGEYEITVRAAGRLAKANTVRMEIRVDGRDIDMFTLNSKMADYKTTFYLSKGSHPITAAFINDRSGRDMAVEKITIKTVDVSSHEDPLPVPEPEVDYRKKWLDLFRNHSSSAFKKRFH
jgi:hypothetical protein